MTVTIAHQDAAPAAPRRRGSYAKTEETRRNILDAALEVFAQSGYRSGSLRDVALRVGMSEAGLLHHFPNKSALLAAVLERRDEKARAIVNLAPDAGADLLSGLIALADYNASTPGVVELYCTVSAEATAPSHPAHQYFVDRYVSTRADVAQAFRTMAQRGQLKPGVEPESAARMTLAVMDGLQVQWLLDRTSVDMARELRDYLAGLTTVTL
jgi:AcrR family transcriptional regulator